MPPQRVPRTQTRRRAEYSPAKRAYLCGQIDAGVSYRNLADETKIPVSTIKYIVKRFRVNNTFESAPRGGKRKTSKRTDRNLLRSVQRTPKQPFAELQQNVAPEVSRRTIARRLAESGIKKWLAAERPLLEDHHAAQRLEWAEKYKDMSEEDWLKVTWSDECTVEKRDGEGQVWVFRTRYQKWDKEKIKGVQKSGRVTQMVWCCFEGGKKGPCIECIGDPDSKRGGVTGRVYLNILKENLPEFIGDNSIFMQDNARVHTYKPVIKWLDDEGITVMVWPPYSPDLNPIEHVWPILKKNLHDHYPELATMKGGRPKVQAVLIPALKHCWDMIEPSVFENLARTMPNRVQAVFKAKGWYTKY
jgi:transposase